MYRISSLLLSLGLVFGAFAEASYMTQAGPSDRDQGYARFQLWKNNIKDRDKAAGYVRYRAYHRTMGTQIIPLKWFAALETDRGQSLAAQEVYESYGFIRSDAPSEFNPYDLPIGFAISEDEKAEKKFGEKLWLGLNCAGCHTTKVKFSGKDVIANREVIIDGNATMFKLNQFEFDLAAIIEKTLQDKQRYLKFAEKVGPQTSQPGVEGSPGGPLAIDKKWNHQPLYRHLHQYARDFKTFLKNNHTRPDGSRIAFSPGSVDALTLGGNMAAGCNRAMWEDPAHEPMNLLAPLSFFGKPTSRNRFYEQENCQAADVPVNIPHIWSTNNFSGGHYAAEETNVTGRNFGAAMTGFGANRLRVTPRLLLDLSIGDGVGFFQLDTDSLLHPETSIKLKDLDANQKWYDSLQAPTWQGLVEAGIVDPMSDEETAQATLGKDIYNRKCSTCHGNYVGNVLENGHLNPVELTEPNVYGAQFWKLTRVPTKEIGTDTARNDRDGIESNKTLPLPLVEKFNELFASDPNFEEIDPDGDRTVAARFYRQFWVLATLRTQLRTEPEQAELFSPTTANGFEMLMGCRDITELRKSLVVADAYKARPLDGVAFTGPYLHNGSVPTLWDLFSPSDKPNKYGAKRPSNFDVGCLNYNTDKMGFVCDTDSNDPALSKGALPFDITRFGQGNQGHEGSVDQDKWGAGASYGTDLSSREKRQLISFLKTLESMENPDRGICELYSYHE